MEKLGRRRKLEVRGGSGHHFPTSNVQQPHQANPDPNRIVRWGDQSDEEMLIGYVECEMDADETVKGNGRSSSVDLFGQLDKNKDGFLTKDEFTRPALFPFFDSNKDGRVTRKEGAVGMAKLKKREDDLRRGQEALRGLLEQFR